MGQSQSLLMNLSSPSALEPLRHHYMPSSTECAFSYGLMIDLSEYNPIDLNLISLVEFLLHILLRLIGFLPAIG